MAGKHEGNKTARRHRRKPAKAVSRPGEKVKVTPAHKKRVLMTEREKKLLAALMSRWASGNITPAQRIKLNTLMKKASLRE